MTDWLARLASGHFDAPHSEGPTQRPCEGWWLLDMWSDDSMTFSQHDLQSVGFTQKLAALVQY